MNQILLYYNYITIEDPDALMNIQRQLCEELGLKGRIIIAKEGINGTVEGTVENTEKYVTEMLKDNRFQDIHFKRSESPGDSFPKLSIKVRDEIVSAHLDNDDLNPTEITGKHITAEELHTWINNKKEFYIVDMRNDYEHKVGQFEGSILAPFGNFRDLPKVLNTLKGLEDKPIVTVCTGGVRCEKASGFLVKHGFKDVYQLYGGIVTYMEKYPNEDFKGKLYVFDGRVVMGFNTDSPEHEIIGKCDKCGKPSEHYVNCANLSCHIHFICCEDCLDKETGNGYCKDCTKT
jgi:UPF0176 protein